jgi:porin
MRKLIYGVLIGCLLASIVWADTPKSSGDDSEDTFWDSPNLTGNWGGLRQKLEDHGVTILGDFTGGVFGNPVGGASQGATYSGILSLGTHIDLEKLLGWKGASLGSDWYWISGKDISSEDHINNFFTVDPNAGFRTYRLNSLWIQQNFFSDKLSIKAGVLAIDSEFENSSVSSLFVNSAFGWSPFLANNIPNGGPGVPMGAPGVRIAVSPVDWFTYQGAVTQGNVYPQDVNQHGFRWRLNTQLFIQEAIFHLNSSGKYWGDYRFGSWIYNGDVPSPAEPDNPNRNFHGDYGFYFMGDQMLIPTSDQSGSDNEKKRGLAGFTHIAFDPPNSNLFEFYADGGLTLTGPFSARSDDALGVAVAYGQLSHAAVSGLTDGKGSSCHGEFLLETSYRIQLSGWMILQPDLQYIVQPGGVGHAPNALVLGLQTMISF